MTSTVLLIDLLGAAALLLFGLRQLKGGVYAAFGSQLRLFLASSTRNRFAAFGSGLLTTLALQSSTVMAVMISSFVAQGLVSAAMAQAVMLGANVGTSLVAQFLALGLHWLGPLALLIGVFAYSRQAPRVRGMGKAIIGLGLMLLSLKLMGEATEPMRSSAAVREFFALLGQAPLIAIAVAATLAAVSASSLAVVLFIAALAGAGGVDATLCLLAVAGANLGGAIPPVWAAAADGLAARRVALTNLAARGLGAVLMLLVANGLVGVLPTDTNLSRLVVDAHLAFNLALAVLLLPLVGPLSALMERLLPEGNDEEDEGPKHLDEHALSNPPSAFASATRETLRVGDIIESMLELSLGALKSNDVKLCRTLPGRDDQVDRLQGAIKLYLAQIDSSSLDDFHQRQLSAIAEYAVNLEHVGDVIERSLSGLILDKIEHQLQFSPEGMTEIEDLFLTTIENLQLAQSVFLSRDISLARRLMETKSEIRIKERQSASHHMDRLREKRPATLQTTSIHLDVLRDLKRINGHLVSAAQPILEEAGLLRNSRLRKG